MRTAKHNRTAGLTLLELLLALTLAAVIAGGVGYSFVAGLDVRQAHVRQQGEVATTTAMERRVIRLLEGAKLTDDSSDATTYIIGEAAQYSDTGELGCDRLTFTTTGDAVPSASMFSTDEFEEQHRARGPVGGVAEVTLGTKAIGDAGSRTGLFERLQRPSDSDTTQGGIEWVLEPSVDRIGFRFWDGLEWVDTWDTQSGERRLPGAIRVSYTLTGEKSTDVHTFTVPIPASDVDADNPLSGSSQ